MRSIRAIFPVIALAVLISGSLIAPLLHELQHAFVEVKPDEDATPIHNHPDAVTVGEACTGVTDARPLCIICPLSSVWDATLLLETTVFSLFEQAILLHFSPVSPRAFLVPGSIRGPPNPFIT